MSGSTSNRRWIPEEPEPPKCRECGLPATVEERYGDWTEIPEGEPLTSYFCANGHLVFSLLRATQADIDRGRELAERYGW